MSKVKGISTAKGFHEKVPFAENADNAAHATNADNAAHATNADNAEIASKLKLDGNSLPLIEISTLNLDKGFEVTETGVYLVIYKKTTTSGYTTLCTDLIAVNDLAEDANGLNFVPYMLNDALYNTPVLSYHHVAQPYNTTENGCIQFGTNFSVYYAIPSGSPTYEFVKAYKIISL